MSMVNISQNKAPQPPMMAKYTVSSMGLLSRAIKMSQTVNSDNMTIEECNDQMMLEGRDTWWMAFTGVAVALSHRGHSMFAWTGGRQIADGFADLYSSTPRKCTWSPTTEAKPLSSGGMPA